VRLVVCAIALSVAGCELSGPCGDDGDCASGLCADNHECATAEAAPPWRIRWTVNGAAVSVEAPGDCDGVAELALRVRSADEFEGLDYRPVRCELGRFEFRALPARFDRIRIDAFAGGDLIDRAEARRGGELTALELVF
jgi:hypothetical protein